MSEDGPFVSIRVRSALDALHEDRGRLRVARRRVGDRGTVGRDVDVEVGARLSDRLHAVAHGTPRSRGGTDSGSAAAPGSRPAAPDRPAPAGVASSQWRRGKTEPRRAATREASAWKSLSVRGAESATSVTSDLVGIARVAIVRDLDEVRDPHERRIARRSRRLPRSRARRRQSPE